MLCSSHHIKTQFNRSHHFLLNITRFSFMMVPPLVFFSRLPGSFSLFSVVSPSSTRLLNVGVLLDIPELRLSLLTLRFLPKESHPFIPLFVYSFNAYWTPFMSQTLFWARGMTGNPVGRLLTSCRQEMTVAWVRLVAMEMGDEVVFWVFWRL